MPVLEVTYVVAVFLAALTMVALAAYAWRRSGLPGVRSFALLLLFIAEWNFSVGMMALSGPDGAAAFWHMASFLGITAVPVAALVFFVNFTGRGSWLPPRRVLLISAFPLFSLALLWTNPLHHIFFTGVRYWQEGFLTVRQESYGPFYPYYSGYAHGLIVLGIAYLIFAALRAERPFRSQNIALLAAILPPLSASICETLQLTNLIIVPFGFVAMAAIMAWSMFRYSFLSLLPVARSKLVDMLPDPIIAVDNENRIIDINPATTRMLAEALGGREPGEIVGRKLGEVLAPWLGELNRFAGVSDVHTEIRLIVNGVQRDFDLRITPIVEQRSRQRGRLIVLREISELKRVQRELQQLATTDTLTQSFNRRRFFELADREVERSRRYHLPLSLILMDLDFFKLINDRHGHPAGDRVLTKFAETCRQNIREIDVFARYGGEEFVLLLPETNLQRAGEAAERLRARTEDMQVDVDGKQAGVTVSLGVADMAGEGDSLEAMLRRADRALYAAKQAGRNRVQSWTDRLASTPS